MVYFSWQVKTRSLSFLHESIVYGRMRRFNTHYEHTLQFPVSLLSSLLHGDSSLDGQLPTL